MRLLLALLICVAAAALLLFATLYDVHVNVARRPKRRPVNTSVLQQQPPMNIPSPAPIIPIPLDASKEPSTSTRQSYAKPIRIVVSSHHFFGKYGERVENCPVPFDSSTYLDCEIVEGPAAESIEQTADALWFHIPSISQSTYRRRFHPAQLLVGMSMESAEYYPLLRDQRFVRSFDIMMSYRQSADVITHYFWQRSEFSKPPTVPTSQKIDAVVFMNSNCHPPSGRDSIVGRLMQRGIRVDSYGSCLHNMQDVAKELTGIVPKSDGRYDKREMFQRYRYCVCIENSVDEDYVTEKLWDGLGAGCLPIYYGAPNVVRDFLPSPQAALLYDPAKPDELAETIKRLSSDNSLYEERMRWRSEPIERLAAGFRRLLDLTRLPPTKCQLCQLVARKRRSSPSSSAVCGTQQPT
jgi:hypothetical protein